MKKMIFSLLVISGFIACQPKTENTVNSVPTNAFGYTIDSSENISTVVKAINAGVNFDTTMFRSIYSDTATIYDNMNKQTVSENMNMASVFKSKGITMKLEKINDIWETVSFKPDYRGITNYVNVYFNVSFIKGDQQSNVRINAVFAFKDGKIVHEWDTYDSAPVAEMFK